MRAKQLAFSILLALVTLCALVAPRSAAIAGTRIATIVATIASASTSAASPVIAQADATTVRYEASVIARDQAGNTYSSRIVAVWKRNAGAMTQTGTTQYQVEVDEMGLAPGSRPNFAASGTGIVLNATGLGGSTIFFGGSIESTALTYAIVSPGPPTLASVFPSQGPSAGGMTGIVIKGTNFSGTTGASSVQIPTGTNAASYVVNSNTQITAVSAASSALDSTIRVAAPGGTVTGLVWSSSAGIVAYWNSDNATNNGTTVTGTDSDMVGAKTLSPTNAPTWTANAVGGHAAVSYNGTTQDRQNTTLTLAQPYARFAVTQQVSSVAFAYFFGGTDGQPSVLDQQGAGGGNTISLYAGAGPVIANVDLPFGTWGIAQSVFNGASSSITVGDGTALTGNAGTHGFTSGFGEGAFSDHTGNSATKVAASVFANAAATGYSAARILAALQRDYEPRPVVVDGTSIEGGYNLSVGATDPWPMQLYASNHGLVPVNPGVTWSSSATTRQVGTPAVSRDFGYPGAPYSGVHPNTSGTINSTASTFTDLALAALTGRQLVILVVGAPTNDDSFGNSLATMQSSVAAYISGRRAAWLAAGGVPSKLKVIVMTMIARTWLSDVYGTATSKETTRTNYNNDVAVNFIATYGADAFADPAASLTDPTNNTYFLNPDGGGNSGVHPTKAGHTLIAASVQSVLTANGWGSLLLPLPLLFLRGRKRISLDPANDNREDDKKAA